MTPDSISTASAPVLCHKPCFSAAVAAMRSAQQNLAGLAPAARSAATRSSGCVATFCASEPTPDPSQEENWPRASELWLPSGGGVGGGLMGGVRFSSTEKTTVPVANSGFSPPAKPHVSTKFVDSSVSALQMDFAAFCCPIPVSTTRTSEREVTSFWSGRDSSLTANAIIGEGIPGNQRRVVSRYEVNSSPI